MARDPIKMRPIAGEAVNRAYGGTGYESAPDHPIISHPLADLARSIKSGFNRVMGNRPATAAEDLNSKYQGQRAYYNAKADRAVFDSETAATNKERARRAGR